MKTILLLLLTTSIALLAQTPPTTSVTNAAAVTNRDEQLRRALRQTIAGKTNTPNQIVGTDVQPANTAATNVPVQLKPAAPTQQPRIAAPLTPPAAQPPTTLTLPAAIPDASKAGETVTINPPPGSAAAAAPEDEKMIGAGDISFAAVEIDKVLTIYAELVGRTVLRPSALPSPPITIRTQTPLTRREAVQALDSVLALNGVTMIPVGEKFVKAVPSAQAQTEGAAFSKLDESQLPEAGQYVTHIVQLKFARPTEVVPVLQPFAKIPNSILPVESSQMLVIRDYAENVKRMLEMIKKIDITVPMEYEPVVIPIKYALAGDIASVLSSLTSGGGGGGGVTGSRGTRGPSASGRPGVGGSRSYPGASASGTLAPNAPAQPGALGAGGARGGSFTDRLQSIVNRAAQGGEFQIIGEAKIIPDERTNSLLIFATKQDLATIKNIVAKLDVVLAQVLIESIIMEVSLDNSRNLGVSYLGKEQGNGYFSGIGAIKNHENFLQRSSFGGSGGIVTNIGLPSGFSYFAKFGNDLDVTATAIAQDSTINVLSRPRIQTSHAVQADLFIGQTVPYVTGTYFGGVTGTGSSSQYQQKDVGITLSVLPLINPDGLVVMDITQDIEQLGTPTRIDGNEVPTTTKRSAAAKVAVKDRETIILGGFISNTKSKSKSGVPFLKDIPLLGYLFRSSSDSNQRVELIVLMRPTVLPTPEAAASQAIIEQDKLPGVKRSKKEYDIDELKRLKKAEND